MELPLVVYSTPSGQSASGNDLSPGTGVKLTPSVTPGAVKDKARDANDSKTLKPSGSPKGTKSGDKKRKLSSNSPDRQRSRSSLRSSSPRRDGIVNGYSSSRRKGSVRRSPDPKRFSYRRCPSAPPASWR